MANEAEESERQRIVALANEDLNKKVPALLADIRQAATKGLGADGAPKLFRLEPPSWDR